MRLVLEDGRSMSGVMVIAEARRGALRPIVFELIAAARALSEQSAGTVGVVLIGQDSEALAEAVNMAGVSEIVTVPTPQAHFEAHVTQAAVEQLIAQRRPSLVLAGHTLESLAFAPAVAARGDYGFAGDVTGVSWSEHGALAQRPAFDDQLVAELDFPGKATVVLLLRPGAFAMDTVHGEDSADPDGDASVERVELDLGDAARSERVELREPPADGAELAKADFVLAIGRGVASAERVPELAALAERIGAALAVSGPLVEAGWAGRGLKVGQSGKNVAPRVYLALGISGAAQHLAGMSRSKTIVAVNTDPNARIFDVARYGAVADLFEVAAELEQELG